MDPVWIWLVVGAILIALELVLPGLITVFFGVAAWLVAGAVWLGLIESWSAMIGAWVLISLVFVLSIRSFLARYISGDQETGNVDEDTEAFGQVVQVTEVDASDPTKGRISFRGTLWDAESLSAPLVLEGQAKLLSRNNLQWIVEPLDPE